MKLVVSLLINAVALWVAARFVPGIHLGGGENTIATILLVAIIFGVVNVLIKPISALVTCPFYLLTLGLFTFIVNALMLLLTSAIARGFELPFVVDGFGAALVGSIVISVVSFVLNLVFGKDDNE